MTDTLTFDAAATRRIAYILEDAIADALYADPGVRSTGRLRGIGETVRAITGSGISTTEILAGAIGAVEGVHRYEKVDRLADYLTDLFAA